MHKFNQVTNIQLLYISKVSKSAPKHTWSRIIFRTSTGTVVDDMFLKLAIFYGSTVDGEMMKILSVIDGRRARRDVISPPTSR